MYESMSSVGAWFCFFNVVSSTQFGMFLSQFSYSPRYSDARVGTIDNSRFDRLSLSRALSESIPVINSLSCSNLFPLLAESDLVLYEYQSGSSAILAKINPLCSTFDSLRCCPECMANRFHSILHQIDTITECVFHKGVKLVFQVPKWGLLPRLNRFVGRDCRFTATLLEQWFKDSDSKLNWPALRKDNVAGDRRASKVVSHLSQALAELRIKTSRPSDSGAPIARVSSYFAKSAFRDTLVAFDIRVPEWPDANGWAPSLPPVKYRIKSSHEVAAAILSISPRDLPYLQWLRNAHCNIEGLNPPWRHARRAVTELQIQALTTSMSLTTEAELQQRLLYRRIAEWLDVELRNSFSDYGAMQRSVQASIAELVQAIAIRKWSCSWVFESSRFSRSGKENSEYLVSKLSLLSSEQLFAPLSTQAKVISDSTARFPTYLAGSRVEPKKVIEYAPREAFVFYAPVGALAEFLDTLLLEDALFIERLLAKGSGMCIDGSVDSEGSIEKDYLNFFELQRSCGSTMVIHGQTDGIDVSFFQHIDSEAVEGSTTPLNHSAKTAGDA